MAKGTRTCPEASGIGLADTAAFGDDQNDIEMLNLCGKGIAAAYAVPGVFRAADEVALSNHEDGIARWLAERCLERKIQVFRENRRPS